MTRGFAALTVLSFLAVLWAPLLWKPQRIPALLMGEASPGAGGPRFQGFREIDRRFEDGFPGRAVLRSVYNQVRYAVFGITPSSIVAGRDGWLFYRSEKVSDGPGFDDFFGEIRYRPADIAWLQDILKTRHEELARRSIRYVAFVAPNKQTTYSDFLPGEILARRRGPTRLDQVFAGFEPGLLNDLRPVMAAAKESRQVFQKTDTHWSWVGGYLAYREVAGHLGRMFPGITPIDPAQLEETRAPSQGDMSAMAGIAFSEEAPVLRAREPFPAHCAATGARIYGPARLGCVRTDPMQPYVTTVADERLPKAVVFHDSFMIYMAPFLAQHFRHVTFSRTPFDPALVEREKPDVVIELRVERYFEFFFSGPPWPGPQT